MLPRRKRSCTTNYPPRPSQDDVPTAVDRNNSINYESAENNSTGNDPIIVVPSVQNSEDTAVAEVNDQMNGQQPDTPKEQPNIVVIEARGSHRIPQRRATSSVWMPLAKNEPSLHK